ncbi:MAG TPA: LysM domain-containing protein, partial [Pyrinomonadaceae bacterium]|nr:LysM domain-containing protein [Pyrinomonadaceae bacterium]
FEHTVTQGERLDQIAAQYLGDPEQFWRICDANGALRPEELLETGRRVRLTLPEGVPATPNA